jgi:NAD(P)-dependent dehydrogenase (short-subunit alcohol dehydrogenase family)
VCIHSEKVASSLGEQGFAPGKVDVSSQQDVKAALQKTVEKYGRLAGVVNCGGVLSVGMTAMPEGVTGEGGIGTIQYEDFERIIRVNLLGTFNVTQQVAQIILGQEAYEGEEEKGVVVNTSSIAFQDGPPGLVAYSASKGGVASMTLPLARDLGYFGIRVMAIAPGSFRKL